MIIRVYGFNVRSRPSAIALAALALGLGTVFVAFGIVLLLGLAALGTALGAGVLVFRSLSGRLTGRLHARQTGLDLDPSLEVFPSQSAAQPRLASSQIPKPEPHQPG